MQLRLLIPSQFIPEKQINPQGWKLHPDVSIKHDDIHARAWECEYESPIFDLD